MNISDIDKKKLIDAFSTRTSLNGNVLNFIGLDEVRERFPSLWENHRTRLVNTATAILKQFTDSKTDIILPIGAGKFIVLFTRLDREEAILRGGIIKAEILRRLIGDEALSGLDLQIQSMELDSGSLTSRGLSDLLSGASVGRTDSTAIPTLGRQFDQPEPSKDLSNVYRASIDAIVSDAPVSVEILEKRFGFDLNVLEFAFQPHLYVKRNVFSVFACCAVRYGATGDILKGYNVLPRNVTSEQISALDQMTLMRARHGLVDMAVRKRVAVVAVPVAFETMSNRSTAVEYLGLLQKIPSDLLNYLVVNLHRCSTGVPDGRLAEIISPLKRLTRAVFVRVSSSRQPLASFKSAGALGVGVELPASASADMGAPDFLGRFAATARKLGLQTHVEGVDTRKQLGQCRAVGIDYIAGRALAELSDYVGPVTSPTTV
ncbi:hypothetical protein BAL199_17158 [alpha proteobacterium BAL199]|jgi:hypothetical protein|nr:hypothetical protein BAL199_17158 [alpha proteobacterium BAL199]